MMAATAGILLTGGRSRRLGVDKATARCAAADDPLLRKYVAFALAFWEGTKGENALMEATLEHDVSR